MKIRRILVTLSLLFAGFLIAPTASIYAASQATVQLLNKARSLEGRGRLDLAAQAWEQVLLADPNNTDALGGLARYAKESGKALDADRYLERLRKLDPNNAAIGRVDDLHSIDSQRGRLDEAQRLAAAKSFESAMRIYRQVFGNEPPAGGWSIAYYETLASCPGGWEDATAGLERLLRSYPDAPEYKLSLGRLWTYRPQTRIKGIQMLESVKGDPILVDKARGAWRQALVWDAGNPASAPFLKSYLDRYPDPEMTKLSSRSSLQAKAENPQQSRGPLQSPEEGLGYKALRSGRLPEAEDHFKAALKAFPHSGSAIAGLGFVRMKQEDFKAAVPLFEQALTYQPKNKSITDALATSRFWGAMKSGTGQLGANESQQATDDFKQALELRPQSVEAAEALAGSYLTAQQPALAVPVYEQLLRLKPESAEYWYGLIKSKYQAGRASDALASLKQAPDSVKQAWMQDPEHLALLSFIYADLGRADESRRLFERAQSAAASKNGELPVDLQMQYAGLSQRLGHASQAAAAFGRLTKSHPSNLEAWEGLINSLVQIPDNQRAYSAFERMPKELYRTALGQPGFLRSVASLESAMRHYDLAEASLRRALEIEKTGGKQPSIDTEHQLADLWVQTGKTSQAEKLLRDLLDDHPDTACAWLSLVSLLHTEKRDSAALEQIRSMPAHVSAALSRDPAFVAVVSGVYTNTGDHDKAQRLIRSSISRIQSEGHVPPADLQIQLAWSLLNGKGNQRELYAILARYSTRGDLTPGQRNDLNQIWSIWCDRRAQAAIKQGDYAQAVSILEAAAKLIPQDSRIQGSLAGAFMRSGDADSAFLVYKNWGLRGASADDYSSAIGAAMKARDSELIIKWLNRALTKYPQNARVLSLAGKEAASQGDYKQANLYFRQALAVLTPEERAHRLDDGTPGQGDGDYVALEQKLGSLLVKSKQEDGEPDNRVRSLAPEISTKDLASDLMADDVAKAQEPTSAASAYSKPEPIRELDPDSPLSSDAAKGIDLLTERTPSNALQANLVRSQLAPEREDPLGMAESGKGVANPVDLHPEYAPSPNAELDADSRNSGEAPPLDSTPMLFTEKVKSLPAKQVQSNLHDEITGDIEAIGSRNTPFFENGVRIQGRGGQGGFDKLLMEEAELAASTTVAGQVRLSLIARPTYLDSGHLNAGSTLGFGTTDTNGTPGSRNAFGIAGEGQLATRDLGIRLGMTPYGFAVRNWIGGFRLNPAGGPFTLLVSRDSIRDTKLSFAGERDPATGNVWGGVIANSASVLGNWGNDKSGFYANLGYQLIRGKQVADNNQINATMGTYFKVLSRNDGALTVGLNFSGMHYDKNLRYFTLGQGGYFSPQQYFLTNVPLRWTGTWNRVFQYSVAGSLGVQHFQENQSAYFPTMSQLQAHSASYYPAYSSTGGNYNLEFKTLYQVTPQWLAGTFANVNNARNYRSASAGIYLKYLFQARPLGADINVDSVPDWKGSQPFALSLSN